ncbi:MAG: hypothetical protein JO257_31885 [Deltaproteobacteria bacterium]|nr:hypothetical protein [Deltaproteobacteria bacterium]
MKKLAAVLFVLVGCGDNIQGSTEVGPDAGTTAPWKEAVPSSVPQLVDLGGGVLAQPKIQPIFFANDPLQAQVEDFLAKIAVSQYWTTAASEYGVGAPVVLPTIIVHDAPPATDDVLPQWMTQHVPTADPNTIYSLFLGDGVVLGGQQGNSCEAYGAFHDEGVDSHGNSLVYALMPRCEPSPQFDHAQTKLDELTISFSHELLEAVTDPRVETTPAFGDVDDDHAILAIMPGAEVGDLCEYLDTAYIRDPSGYMVQRTWSNAAAKAGHDPCVPAPATTYISAAPVFTDPVSIDGFTGPRTTKALKLAVGASKTIEVDVFSDTPTPDAFDIQVDDSAALSGGPAELTFTWDKSSGKNGDKLHLTVTRATAPAQGSPGSIFTLSTKTAAGTVSQWIGYVAQ